MATPIAMIAPINAGTLKVVCVKNNPQTTPASAPGSAVMMMNGIEPALKIHHEQEINQNDRHGQAEAEADVARPHGFGLAAHDDVAALRQILFDFFDERLDVAQNAAEVAAVHAAVNINDRHHVVMRNDRRNFDALDAGDVGENLVAGPAGVDGHGFELLHRINRILRRADVDEVLHADVRD